MPGWDFIAASFRVADYARSSGENIGRATELYRTIQQATSLPILFVPIARAKADSDAATARWILEEGQLQGAVAEGCCCAAEAKGVLGLARLAVGMSWHFCVFSLSQNVPTICISVGDYYVQKGRALARVWQDDGLHAPLGATDCPEVVRRAVARLERPERAKLQDRNTQLLGMQEEYFDRVAEIHSGSINSNSEAIQ
jgi:polysaccharide pyruvyl transferase WcaK-like protein